MKKIYTLIKGGLLITLFSACTKKLIEHVVLERERPKTQMEYFYQQKAKEFAYNTWTGNAYLINDTFYFTYTEYLEKADSVKYRAAVLDLQAPKAFRYTFAIDSASPDTWVNRQFDFRVQFFDDNIDTIIHFQYLLKDNLMFRFP